MITHLSGRFRELSEYSSNDELLRRYLDIISYPCKTTEKILRIHQYTYDVGIIAISYVICNKSILFVLVNDDIVLQPNDNLFERLLKSERGFLEIYELDHSEFEVDMEILNNKFLILDRDPNNSIIRLKASEFINKVQNMLGMSGEPKRKTRSTQEENIGVPHSKSLIYSEELSEKLKDVTFRAQILLKNKYKLFETNADKFLDITCNILLTERKSIAIIIKVNSHSIWIVKQSDSSIGFLPLIDGFSDSDNNYSYNIESCNDLQNLILKIISKYRENNKRAKVKMFIYDLD